MESGAPRLAIENVWRVARTFLEAMVEAPAGVLPPKKHMRSCSRSSFSRSF